MLAASLSSSSSHNYPAHSPSCIQIRDATYTRQLDAAVAALGGSATLLDVKDALLTTGGLDDPRPVRGGVVSADHKLEHQ